MSMFIISDSIIFIYAGMMLNFTVYVTLRQGTMHIFIFYWIRWPCNLFNISDQLTSLHYEISVLNEAKKIRRFCE